MKQCISVWFVVLFAQMMGCGRAFEWPTIVVDPEVAGSASVVASTVTPPTERIDVSDVMHSLTRLDELETEVLQCGGDSAREFFSEEINFKVCALKTLDVTFPEIEIEQQGKLLLSMAFTYRWPAQLPIAQLEQVFALVPELRLDVYHIESNNVDDILAIAPELDDAADPLPQLRVGKQTYYRFFTPGMTHEVNYVVVYENLLFKFTGKSFPSVVADAQVQREVDEAFMMVVQSLDVL